MSQANLRSAFSGVLKDISSETIELVANKKADAVVSAYKAVEMEDEELIKNLKDAYTESKKWYLEQLELASEAFREMYKNVYGFSDKKINKEKEFTSDKLKFFRGASNILFMCSLLAFLLAFVILIIAI